MSGGVAAGVLRVFGFEREFDEAGAEALDLFFYDGAQVVGGDDGAETARGGDGLESRDADAEDQNARWRDRASGGGEHREKFGNDVGGDEDGFVSGDGRHRRERVHALRARGAGDEFDGEGRDAAIGEIFQDIDGVHRAEEADDDLIGAELREIFGAGFVVRAGTEDLDDDVGGAENFGAVGNYFCAFGGVVGVGISGFDSGAGFDDDFEANFGEVREGGWDKCDATFPGERFSGYTNDHRGASQGAEWQGRTARHCTPRGAVVDGVMWSGTWVREQVAVGGCAMDQFVAALKLRSFAAFRAAQDDNAFKSDDILAVG